MSSFNIIRRFHITHLLDYVRRIPHYIKKSDWYHYLSSAEKIGVNTSAVKGGSETYLFDIQDIAIPIEMYFSKKTFSQDDILSFFRLAKKFRGLDPSGGGVFLDIGANIGTTCIYVKKRFKKLDVWAFEPEKRNFSLLSANVALNECFDMKLYNKAVSDEKSSAIMRLQEGNSGGNKIVTNVDTEDRNLIETVETVRIDDIVLEADRSYEDVKYIWIDVEGHEAQAVDGMMSLLIKSRPCMLMELTPKNYPLIHVSKENFELLYKNLHKVYEKIIVIGEENKTHSIDYLRELYYSSNEQRNIFLY